MDSINNISIGKEIWIGVRENCISFSFGDLPSQLHFTLSFHPNSSEINFHVTKNVSNQKCNPKNVVFTIGKDELLQLSDGLIVSSIIYSLLQPFKPIRFESKKNKRNKIAIVNFDEENEPQIKENFSKKSEPFYNVKGGRLRVANLEGLESHFPDLASIQDIFPLEFKRFNGTIPRSCPFCIIQTQRENIIVFQIGGCWFTPKKNLSISDLLIVLTGPKLASSLFYKLKKAIVIVRGANSYEDVRGLYDPIRLVVNRSNQNM